MRRLGWAALACWAGLAWAQAEEAPATRSSTVELAHQHDSLTRGLTHWRDTSLSFAHSYAPRQTLALFARQTRRFELDDTEIGLGYWHPLGQRLTLSIDAAGSPTHRVLARHSLGANLQYEFAPAWLLHTGYKSTRYNNTDVRQGQFMLEHYFASFSASLAWRPVSALSRRSDSFELRGSYYYGDKSMVGLILAAGQEATATGSQGVVLADVRSAALLGRHWLGNHWALTYAIARTRQGSFYTRTGVRLGVQRAF